MFIRRIRFPVSGGYITTEIREGLGELGWSDGLTVGTQKPEVNTRRMVILRDDSGPQVGRLSRRRHGGNVWADDRVSALKLALDTMMVCRELPDGTTVTGVDSFTGPFEIEDDVPMTVEVDGETRDLSHFYFAFRADVKGSKPVPAS